MAAVGKALAVGGRALGIHLGTQALLHSFMDKKEKRRHKRTGKIITVRKPNPRADDIANLTTPFASVGLETYLAARRKK